MFYSASPADGCLRHTRVTFWPRYVPASQFTILVFCNQRYTFGAGARGRVPLNELGSGWK